MAVVEWLESLSRQHRVIENTLHDLEKSPSADEATIKRLKIEKLALKDRMSAMDTRQLEAAE
jgi:hypothetical protein